MSTIFTVAAAAIIIILPLLYYFYYDGFIVAYSQSSLPTVVRFLEILTDSSVTDNELLILWG